MIFSIPIIHLDDSFLFLLLSIHFLREYVSSNQLFGIKLHHKPKMPRCYGFS